MCPKTMENIQRNDALLMELLNEKQSVEGFLEAIFGFMARRTDFYIEMKHPTDTMGFPPGINEEIVLQSMRKWKTLLKADQQIPFAKEIEIGSNDTVELEVTTTVNEADLTNEYKNISIQTSTPVERYDFPESEYYNGAIYGNYCWSQSINEIDIFLHLPKHITSPRNILVIFETNRIKICEKGNENNVLLEGEIFKPHTCSIWMISGRKLHLTIDKRTEGWWEKLLITEPSLDLKTINCSRPIDELPDDTQATIAKLQWDAEQKRQGKPTSDEFEQHKLLRKAWDVDGSPFKGTPFDPDSVKFN